MTILIVVHSVGLPTITNDLTRLPAVVTAEKKTPGNLVV